MNIFYMLIIIMFPAIIGCTGYYNAQIEFYKAQSNSNIAYLDVINNRKPIAEMVAPDGTVFRVNNSDAIAQPVIVQATNPFVDGVKSIVNSTPASILSSGWAIKEIVNQSVGNSSTTNTGNTSVNGNIDQSSTDSSATATPTVVTQPQPIIVTQPEPVIVKPEVVITKETTNTTNSGK